MGGGAGPPSREGAAQLTGQSSRPSPTCPPLLGAPNTARRLDCGISLLRRGLCTGQGRGLWSSPRSGPLLGMDKHTPASSSHDGNAGAERGDVRKAPTGHVARVQCGRPAGSPEHREGPHREPRGAPACRSPFRDAFPRSGPLQHELSARTQCSVLITGQAVR